MSTPLAAPTPGPATGGPGLAAPSPAPAGPGATGADARASAAGGAGGAGARRRAPTSARAAWHVMEFNWLRFRRIWRTAFTTSFLQPLMYLAGMGLGVGALVERSGGEDRLLGGVDYVTYLGPGLLVATASIHVAANEATWPVLAGFKWQETYLAQTTTPIGSTEIVLGVAGWIGLRCALSATAVGVALGLYPATRSIGLPLAVVVAVLTALAVATPTMAFAASKEKDTGFVGYHRFVITPIFLFGGAFYPISQLPAILRPVAQATPLWHGVELARMATFAPWRTWAALGHLAYLLAWIVTGLMLSMRQFARRLAR